MISMVLKKLLVCVFAFVCVWTGNVYALQTGAAKLALELPLGGPLGGHVYRQGRAVVAQHDPITVRALYLEESSTRLMLVSVDVHSITSELRERIVSILPEGIEDNHLIVTATHTHNGPGGLADNWLSRRYMGGYDPEMVGVIAEGVAQVMGEAVARKARGTIGYTVSNKLLLNENMFSSDGLRDGNLGVIRVDDSDGNPIAILGSFSAHPTTISASNSFTFSADYPGYFCTQLEALSHENTVAFFLNGAVGDQACNNLQALKGWAWTEYVGTELAVQVKSIANKIECKEYPITLNSAMIDTPSSSANSFINRSVLFQALEINDLLVTFIPGEPYAEVKRELDRRAKARGYMEYIAVGLSNDYVMDIAGTSSAVVRKDLPGLNVFGPEGAQWCYEAVSVLMSRGQPQSSAKKTYTSVTPNAIDGGYRVHLKGSAIERIWQRGNAFSSILQAPEHLNEDALGDEGINTVELPLWSRIPNGIRSAAIAGPLTTDAHRATLGRLKGEQKSRLHVMASGAGVSSESLWLLQNDSVLKSEAVVYGVYGDRAGQDGALLGYVATAPSGASLVVAQETPMRGRSYMHVAGPEETGLRFGMNDAGVVMGLLPRQGELPKSQLRFDMASILASTTDLAGAVGAVKELNAESDTALLILDRPVDATRYMNFKSYWRETEPKGSSFLPESASDKVSLEELERLLGQQAQEWLSASTETGLEAPTVYAVVFHPAKRSVYLAVSNGTSFPEDFTVFTLERGAL